MSKYKDLNLKIGKSISLDADLVQKINQEAKKLECSFSKIIEEMAKKYLKI